MIYITSDHAGFEHKNKILKSSKLKGKLVDVGPFEYDSADNYPDFVNLLVSKVNESPAKNTGIILCNNGVGVSMMANKFKGIRAGLSWDVEQIGRASCRERV
mgnify:CR=1 FL=1